MVKNLRATGGDFWNEPPFFSITIFSNSTAKDSYFVGEKKIEYLFQQAKIITRLTWLGHFYVVNWFKNMISKDFQLNTLRCFSEKLDFQNFFTSGCVTKLSHSALIPQLKPVHDYFD